MNKLFLAVLLILLGVSAGTMGAWAQSSEAMASADHTAPSYDMKAQSLVDLARVQRNLWTLPTRFRRTNSPGVRRRTRALSRKYFFTWRASATGF